MSDARGVAVIGVGNPIMGDDGLGLAALARLREGWEVPPEVSLIDGGTWGMNLLPLIEDAEAVIFLDAITAGRKPGEAVELERDALPKWVALKLSPHQMDLKEVLALAELRGTLPERAVAIGAEPAWLELSTSLSREAAGAVESVATRAAQRLGEWGFPCPKRPAACTN
jgi:hydrogenase maturation protease